MVKLFCLHMHFHICYVRARLKAIRLQNYWKKICEDEKRSQWRNEQLLRDFDRVESHMATLSARTDRLRTMKVLHVPCINHTFFTVYMCMPLYIIYKFMFMIDLIGDFCNHL
jgi:hypothetical protein